MKIVIPLAGLGTRLRPHTHSKPKPLVHVGGKPALGHILDTFEGLNIEEIIFITGHLGDQIKTYVDSAYPQIKTRYLEQKTMTGQSPAVYLAKEFVQDDLLIIFADTIFETDLKALPDFNADGVLHLKRVADPSRFGVGLLDDEGFVTKLIEKPQDNISDLAVVGVYYFKQGQRLFRAIERQFDQNLQIKNEFYLADAISLMLADGAKFRAVPMAVWYDTGQADALLETNRYLLEKAANQIITANLNNSVIIPPVYIDPQAKIENSVIGPYVSVAAGTLISHSVIRDSIIHPSARINNAVLEKSIIGNRAKVSGKAQSLNLGDDTEV
jgi:glucose-1-phosphate thymidylyltransferase